MLQGSEGLALLDTGKYLYLRELSEPRDNSLVLVAEEAILNQSRNVEADSLLPAAVREAGILKAAHPIESTENCKIFKLYWKHYAAYLVTEELVGSNGQGYDDEVYTGGLLRHYTKSHFLEHLGRDTGGHLSPVQHYKLICLNHLIDVASYEPPEIDLVTDPPDVGRFRMV